MTDEDWKAFIAREMERDLDDVMAEINADPAMKDIKAPESIHDNLMVMIREYERQKAFEQLADEDKELIRLGKVYKKHRVFNGFIVALAAVIVGLGIGSVCVGDDNIIHMFTEMFDGREKTEINSEDVKPILYTEEDKIFEEIEKTYGFTPVKLEYLPNDTIFYEATLSSDLQSANLIYEIDEKTSIIYVIRPNYREASLGIDIEDKKIQDYELIVNNVEVIITEYDIIESDENRWSICFVYYDVQYLLRITNLNQDEVEKIANNLRF